MRSKSFLIVLLLLLAISVLGARGPLWWTVWAGEKTQVTWGDKMLEDFKRETGINIIRVDLDDEEFKISLQSSFGAGNPPDLWHSWGGGVFKSYAQQGVVHDITDLLNEDWALELIPRSVLGGITYEGKVYGLPYTSWVGHIYINTDLFKKAGVKIPDADKGEVWTWDEFIDAINKFNAKKIIPIVVGGREKWELSFFYMYLVDRIGGSEAFANAISRKPAASFYSEPFIKAGYYVQELVDNKAFQPGFLGYGYGDAERLFIAGRAAMYLMGPWCVGNIRSVNPNFPLDVIAFPTVPGGKGDPSMVLGAVQTYFCISEASKYKDELREFLKFLARPENIKEFVKTVGDIVVFNVDLPEGSYDPVVEKQIRLMRKASFLQMAYDQASPPAFASAHLDAVAGLFAKKLTPEEAALMQEKKAMQLHKDGILP